MAPLPKPYLLLLLILLVFLSSSGHGARLLSSSSSGVLRLPAAAAECEQTYGFLPCTTTVTGNLFLVVAYGFLMFKAATFLSSGSERLLVVLGPGIVGGLLLPILGALPDALLILVSGLSGSRETAQSQVLIGMGLLAGSTVMLLTLLWGSCIVVGKCDLSENQTALYSQDTKGFNLVKSGVSTDKQTSYSARIMAISIIPFIIVQFPKILKSEGSQRVAVLVSLIVSALMVLSYCLYQVFQPWVQKRKLAYAKHKHVISGILRHAHLQSLGRLLHEDGTPNVSVIRKLFNRIDLDQNGTVSRSELRAFMIGIDFEDIDLDRDDSVDKIMDDFDTSGNDVIEESEFIKGISKWLHDAKRTVPYSGSYSMRFIENFHMRTREEHVDLLTDASDEAVETTDNPVSMIVKAVSLLLLGTVIAAAFADPLVDAVHNFSQASKIPSFFISFIFMPLATNSSEAVSAIIFASRKKLRTTSLTFSEIYGGVTMNNTLCVAVFLALIYVRNLTWDFASEVLVILLVVIIMGLFTSFRTSFPVWTSLVAFLLYPLTLVIVYVLDFILGWS